MAENRNEYMAQYKCEKLKRVPLDMKKMIMKSCRKQQQKQGNQ